MVYEYFRKKQQRIRKSRKIWEVVNGIYYVLYTTDFPENNVTEIWKAAPIIVVRDSLVGRMLHCAVCITTQGNSACRTILASNRS
jgi:NhaP-type Na+/H+ or K+/H+ antiporter